MVAASQLMATTRAPTRATHARPSRDRRSARRRFCSGLSRRPPSRDSTSRTRAAPAASSGRRTPTVDSGCLGRGPSGRGRPPRPSEHEQGLPHALVDPPRRRERGDGLVHAVARAEDQRGTDPAPVGLGEQRTRVPEGRHEHRVGSARVGDQARETVALEGAEPRPVQMAAAVGDAAPARIAEEEGGPRLAREEQALDRRQIRVGEGAHGDRHVENLPSPAVSGVRRGPAPAPRAPPFLVGGLTPCPCPVRYPPRLPRRRPRCRSTRCSGPLRLGAVELPQPHAHGAHDARPRGGRRHPERADGDLLRAARHGGRSSSPRPRRSRARAWAGSARRACTPTRTSPAGAGDRRGPRGRRAASSSSCGTWAASRTPTSTAARCPSGRRRSRPKGETHTPLGKKPYVTPRALETAEIARHREGVRRRRRGARATRASTASRSTARTATSSTSSCATAATTAPTATAAASSTARASPSRCVEACAAAWSADRVGIRLSPRGTYNDMADSDRGRDVRPRGGAPLAARPRVPPRRRGPAGLDDAHAGRARVAPAAQGVPRAVRSRTAATTPRRPRRRSPPARPTPSRSASRSSARPTSWRGRRPGSR